MFQWTDPVGFLKKVTPAVRKNLAQLEVETIADLLLTLPRRYDDYSRTVPIREAPEGQVVTVKGTVTKCAKLPTFRKRFQIIRVGIQDETGSIAANFFNQPWLLTELTPGKEIVMSGKVVMHPRYGRSLEKPLWEPAEKESVATGKVAPVYPLTGSLSQNAIRQLVPMALAETTLPPDPAEDALLERHHLLSFADALKALHQPESLNHADRGRERLAFDELMTYRLSLGAARIEADTAGAPVIPFEERFAKRFAESLPFPLTADQKRAVWAAIKDMEVPLPDKPGKARPMRRLLQGDVGSGKTAVAAFLCAHIQRIGASAVILAPTDILAQQHAVTLRRMFAGHHIPLMLVTRTDKRWFFEQEERVLKQAEIEEEIARGHAVIVGTHALLFGTRLPPDLALAIVDEQHRFGVGQRETLLNGARKDGLIPHFLSMTATPIPRSLALTLYGDLDVSILREKPAGRKPVDTKVCVGEMRESAYQAIREAVKRGEQAFLVCALIDPSDSLGVNSATEEFGRLKSGPLVGLRLGLLHGRLKPAEKEAVMTAFSKKELDVLVSTAVIEVGVDVPQATVMLIENAERFGLAQLHQLRGRVGRSSFKSYCFLGMAEDGPAIGRLRVLEKTQDGFAVAEADLSMRGEGNVLGTQQSGEALFKTARIDDVVLISAAKEQAEQLAAEDATYQSYPALHQRIQEMRENQHRE
jgi:ATP-dependent DNA helicase RecG